MVSVHVFWRAFFRRTLCVALATAVGATSLVCNVTSVSARGKGRSSAPETPLFGNPVAGSIDERNGALRLECEVFSLPGRASGGVSATLVWSQEMMERDRHGVGRGWMWSGPFIDVGSQGGGVRVYSEAGEQFEADVSQPSGLRNHAVLDRVFRQQEGLLSQREGVSEERPFQYLLERAGAGISYFDAEGNRVADEDRWGNRTDYVWNGSHRLESVVDDAGNRVDIRALERGFEILMPARSDGVIARTQLTITEGTLTTITNPVEEHVEFGYGRGLAHTMVLQRVTTRDGAVSDVTYQVMPDGGIAVDSVRLSDATTGQKLSSASFSVVGENTWSGWPRYTEPTALQNANDEEYRYQTALSWEGLRIVSEFDSSGRPRTRTTMAALSNGSADVIQQQRLDYPSLVTSYRSAQPFSRLTTFHDAGRTRETREDMTWDDLGRLIRHVAADGTTTSTAYDNAVPAGRSLPLGLSTARRTVGFDGMISETRNVLAQDRESVIERITRVGSSDDRLESADHTRFVTEGDGFVAEERRLSVSRSEHGPSEIVTTFTRVDDGQIITTKRTDAAGTDAKYTTSVMTDKATGRVIGEKDAVGRTSTIEYDSAGRRTSEIDFSGARLTTAYGTRVIRTTTNDGVIRSDYRDALGRVILTVDNIHDGKPDGGHERVAESRTYDPDRSRVTVRDSWGRETTIETDVFGRLTEVRSPTSSRISEFDDVGNMTRTGTVSQGTRDLSHAEQVVSESRDDAGRLVNQSVSVRNAAGPLERTISYDGLGRMVRTTADGLETSIETNPDGTPGTTHMSHSASRGGPTTISRTYSGIGGISTQKTVSDNTTSRHGGTRYFDAAGRVEQETDQVGHSRYFRYTADGLVTETNDPHAGITVTNSYDARTRLLIESETRHNTNTETLDRQRRAYEHDTHGRVTAVFDPDNRSETLISYVYDIFGNRTATQYPDGTTITHTFDAHGRKTSTTDIAGNVTVFESRSDGLLEKARQVTRDGNDLASVSYEYDGYGRVTTLTRDGGLVTRYTMMAGDHIAEEKTWHGSSLIFAGSYRYDGRGNLVTAQRTSAPIDDEKPESTETTEYRYDEYNRLIESALSRGDGEAATIEETNTYDFSVSGDVVHHTRTRGGSREVREFQYNDLGQLTIVSNAGIPARQEFDQRGNLTLGTDGTRYSYTVSNEREREERSDGRLMTYEYWADGKRKAVVDSDGRESHVFYWDGETLLNDVFMPTETSQSPHDVSASRVSAYLVAGKRHARTIDGETQYYVSDRHGSVMATVMSNGQATERYRYGDYGETSASLRDKTNVSANPYQFAGEFTDDRGRQMLGARVYDPEQMRFTSRDRAPLHNVYAYADGNPITRVDPTGETAIIDEPWFRWLELASFATTLFLPAGALGFLGRTHPTILTASFSTTAFFSWADAAVSLPLAITSGTSHDFSRDVKGVLATASLLLGGFTVGTIPVGFLWHRSYKSALLRPARKRVASVRSRLAHARETRYHVLSPLKNSYDASSILEYRRIVNNRNANPYTVNSAGEYELVNSAAWDRAQTTATSKLFADHPLARDADERVQLLESALVTEENALRQAKEAFLDGRLLPYGVIAPQAGAGSKY